jgi:hypothetical protein
VSAPFTNIVMPDSLLTSEEIKAAYDHHDALFQLLAPDIGNVYLGAPLQRLFDPAVRRHALTDLPSLLTEERAVNPDLLRAILLAELHTSGQVEILSSALVSDISGTETGATVSWTSDNTARQQSFAAVVNCAWENQAAFVSQNLPNNNLRFKTGLRLPRAKVNIALCDTVTLVIGPYGDMVVHDSFVYLSWYPIARTFSESGASPSPAMAEATLLALNDKARAQAQLDVFVDLGFLGADHGIAIEDIEITGGYILGEGKRDIDDIHSGLHSRPDRGILREGLIFSPRNYKFTTAPMMAVEAARAVTQALALALAQAPAE